MAYSRILKTWQKGEVLTATGVNDIQNLLQSVTHAPTETPGENVIVRWVRMKEAIGPAANFHDREAVIQYWDEATNKWKDTNPEQEIKVSDLTEKLYYAKDSIVPVFSHRSGKYVPLSGHATTLLCKAIGLISIGAHDSGFTIQSGTPASNANSGISTLPEIHFGMTIAIGKLFLAHLVNDCWMATAWECNTEE